MNVLVKMSKGSSRRSSHQRRTVLGLRPVRRANPCCVIPRSDKAARRSEGSRMLWGSKSASKRERENDAESDERSGGDQVQGGAQDWHGRVSKVEEG